MISRRPYNIEVFYKAIIFKQNMKTTNYKRNAIEQTAPRFLQSSASTKFISYEHIPLEIQNENIQLSLPTTNLESEIKMYEWRQKTELPIVKIISFKASLSDSQKAVFDIEHEPIPLRLAQLKDLPLFKTLYLMKESIIGFERIYAKLGTFKITPKMIALNQNNKCKVWCSENLASNSYENVFGTEADFLKSIYSLFFERANKLKNTSLFFNELNYFQTFCQALLFIENFARENKITIPNSCKISPNEKISVGSTKNFDPSMTMSKAPTFLVNPMSVTLSHKNNSHIINQIRKQCQTEPTSPLFKRKNLEMKASGDTAADMNGSKTQSIINKEDDITESLMFVDADKDTTVINLKTEKKSLFTRKYSQKEDNYKINCFTPSLNVTTSWEKDSHHFGKNDYKFLGEDSDEETDPERIKQLFSTNNWKMALNGLFSSEEGLKKSFHKGKETRKVQGHQTLHLLDKIGKNMIESQIQEGHEY